MDDIYLYGMGRGVLASVKESDFVSDGSCSSHSAFWKGCFD